MHAAFPLLVGGLWGLAEVATAQTFGSVDTYAGTGNAGLTNGTFSTCEFHGPYDIVEGVPAGTFFVADGSNHCVRKLSGGTTSLLAGNGSSGDQDGQGLNARFHAPTGICYHAGFIYVTDNGNNKIKRVDTLGNVVTIAGTGSAGCVDGPAMLAEFNNPVGITADAMGVLYVADYGNSVIRKIESGTVSLYAGVCGSPGDATGPLLNAQFNDPSDLEIGINGDVYIVDQSNNKIKRITQGGLVELLAGSGSNASVDGVGAAASFNGPAFIDSHPNGNLVVTDWMGHVVRAVTPGGVVTTVAGSGTSGFINGSASTARFSIPYGICCTSSGEVLVGDNGNHVLRRLVPKDISVSVEDSGVEGETEVILVLTGSNSLRIPVTRTVGPLRSMHLLDIAGRVIAEHGIDGGADDVVREFRTGELSSGLYALFLSGSKGETVVKLLIP